MAGARLPAYFGIKGHSQSIQFTSTLTQVDTVDIIHSNDDTYITVPGENEIQATSIAAGFGLTVRFLTHVLCKPTHFFFHSFIATMSYSHQTSFNSLMKDWADTYHVWGTPTRSPLRSNAR